MHRLTLNQRSIKHQSVESHSLNRFGHVKKNLNLILNRFTWSESIQHLGGESEVESMPQLPQTLRAKDETKNRKFEM